MRHRQPGVTLIELLVVMVIVGMVGAIAIPGFRQYVLRAKRIDAKNALLGTAMSLEQCFARSTPASYVSATCAAAVNLPRMSPEGTYRIEFLATTSTTYQIQAVPIGGQAADIQCGTFILDNTNLQTVTGTLAVTPMDCWRR